VSERTGLTPFLSHL